MDMALPVVNATAAALARVSAAFNAPFARAVVFGVHIDGHLVVEGLLITVIVFQLSRKSYKPPKKPLTEKEIDELCDEWEPEPLCPPIKEGGRIDTPMLESDEGVQWAVQNGLHLSRSTVVYFKHNDMASLASTLEKLTRGNKRAEKIRRYIVVESIYQNSGQIAPLDEIVKLKEKYRFRVILEESHSFGVLGKSGRGLAEHYGVPIEKIDIITAGMGNALATDGGFCTGSVRVVDHQRLSSAGYVFSASLPPYLATAAVSAVNYLEENPSVLTNLRSNIAALHKELSDTPGLEISSHILSPIVFLKLKKLTGSPATDLDLLETIAERVLKEDSVFIVTSKKSNLDRCRLPLGIRLFVSAGHTESDISMLSSSLKRVSASVLSDYL
ncbi:hypothetical protein PR202_ga26367 [Eleusine coracana subsp. coracana]|uniref:serine C-palmitoyltransferase n=1 Tax=Eleusine coracana subsp. coracana TaxID=191504 RepID=A0AAV5DD94_ELECO|nr:hypothetical protein PR202_ga26367 [Eleusine coracana subsp. coracana]